ncbi:MAG: hypothetical protein ACP5JJ_13600, partial [Anaerolineae bacterium]
MIELSEAQRGQLEAFERGLDPRWPERSRIPATILGYGEISTVFAIDAGDLQGLAFKRMPLFETAAEVQPYRVAYEEYTRRLEEVGLHLPEHGYAWFDDEVGRPNFYIIQKRQPVGSIGNQALHVLPDDQVLLLVQRILGEMHRVWAFNRQQA